MGGDTKIEWTHKTWNPVASCTKISPGCKNCYAERFAKRLKAMGQWNYVNGFEVTCHDTAVFQPLHWKKPKAIFVNSMCDLFHGQVEFDFIWRIFAVMRGDHRRVGGAPVARVVGAPVA